MEVEYGVGNKVGKFPIELFKFEMFLPNPSIVMIAKRGSGKSWVVRAILEYLKDLPAGCIISPTDLGNPFYGSFFPEAYIHYEFKPEIIKKILDRQRIIKKKIKSGKNIDPRCYIIMDDCLASKGAWIKDPDLKHIFFNGRHEAITYILTMQFSLGITPELRSNFDYIFLLADDMISNVKRLYDHYAGMFPTFDSFRQVFTQLTADHGAMVIVNRGTKKDFAEKIFWYKAGDIDKDNLKFGHKQFRTFHEKNFNENWQDKKEDLNADEYMLRKKKEKGRIVIDRVIEGKTVKKNGSV